jgi:hypothetical protein
MLKSLIVLAIAGTMSVPVAAQTAQNAPTANQAQPAKPQMVKKRVCEDSDNPYSRLKTRTCKTVMVPAPTAANNQGGGDTPAQQPNNGH